MWLLGENSYLPSIARAYSKLENLNSCVRSTYEYDQILNVQTAEALKLRILDSDFISIDLRKIFFDFADIETNKCGIRNFASIYRESRNLISMAPKTNNMLNQIVKNIVVIKQSPIGKPLREGGSGLSVHWLKHTLFLSAPKYMNSSTLELALNVVHECGHQVLMLYQDADCIIKGDLLKPVFSSVRKCERPAILSFHALVAVYFMYYFVIEISKQKNNFSTEMQKLIEEKKVILQHDFVLGLSNISTLEFSDLGLQLTKEMTEFFLLHTESA